MALWSTPRRFSDRAQAGRHLASLLTGYAGRDDVLVLGLPRGGVPVAAEVARALGAPLDVLVVRKLGAPGRPELAIGAIADVGTAVEMVMNAAILQRLAVTPAEFDEVYRRELVELRRRTAGYRGNQPPVTVTRRVVIIVDDGLATGASMRAAVAAIRMHRPAGIVVAVPIGPQQQDGAWGEDVEVVCGLTPARFSAVHQGYEDFGQTTDEQVLAALAGTRNADRSADGEGGPQRDGRE